MMEVICSGMVVICANRRGKCKRVQLGNKEWATVIIGINGEGWNIPPFLVVQGTNYISTWYTTM